MKPVIKLVSFDFRLSGESYSELVTIDRKNSKNTTKVIVYPRQITLIPLYFQLKFISQILHCRLWRQNGESIIAWRRCQRTAYSHKLIPITSIKPTPAYNVLPQVMVAQNIRITMR